MKKIILHVVFYLCLLSLIVNPFLLAAQHFQAVYNNNPYKPMSIILNSCTLDALNLQTNDEIAVFDINENGNEICVGETPIINEFTSDTTYVVTTSADDPTTQIQDGFIEGHNIIYRIWDSSDNIEIVLTKATYDTTLNIVFTDYGTASISLISSTFETWDGNQDSLWNNILNWDYEKTPSTKFNILIPTSPTGSNWPSINTQTAKCKNLTIEDNAIIKIHGKLTIGTNEIITD